jgi:hypothetical protein
MKLGYNQQVDLNDFDEEEHRDLMAQSFGSLALKNFGGSNPKSSLGSKGSSKHMSKRMSSKSHTNVFSFNEKGGKKKNKL